MLQKEKDMRQIVKACGIVAIAAASVLFPRMSRAGCTVSHLECHYECIEYYPNGTDCRKTKKICERVCDDFNVKPSGDTPHSQPKAAALLSSTPKAFQGAITLTGTVSKLEAADAETMQWSMRLDATLPVGRSVKVNDLELDPGKIAVASFEGKRIEAAGTIMWRHAPGRGDFPVLAITGMTPSNE